MAGAAQSEGSEQQVDEAAQLGELMERKTRLVSAFRLRERELFVDNLLVRIHLIIEVIMERKTRLVHASFSKHL